jgi:hypothetical protein
MDGTSTSAMLVDTPPVLASESEGLTATVRREDIEAALTSDPPSDLALDILRKVDGADRPERRTVTVAWKRTDLESVLRDADAEAITFSFDPAELERLLAEPDVEGHGLREAAVVLSIAAVAAVGGAASASAATHDEATFTARGIPSGSVVAIHDEASFAARGIEPGTIAATHDEAGLTARGIIPVAATHDEASFAARGIAPGTVAATHDEANFAARGIDPGTVAATHDEASFAARGIDPGTVAATHDEASFAARGIDPGTVAATHEEMSFTSRGIESTPAGTGTVSGGPSWDLPTVDPAMVAGIVAALGAFGLAILGASFVTRRREPGAV